MHKVNSLFSTGMVFQGKFTKLLLLLLLLIIIIIIIIIIMIMIMVNRSTGWLFPVKEAATQKSNL